MNRLKGCLALLSFPACFAGGIWLMSVLKMPFTLIGLAVIFLPMIVYLIKESRERRAKVKENARYGGPAVYRGTVLRLIDNEEISEICDIVSHGAISGHLLEGADGARAVALLEAGGYVFTLDKAFTTAQLADALGGYLDRRRCDARVTERDITELQHSRAAQRREAGLDMTAYDLTSAGVLLRRQGYELTELVTDYGNLDSHPKRRFAAVSFEDFLRLRHCNVFTADGGKGGEE